MVTLGPRVLKTGMAVTLAIYIAQWLGLEPPLFAAIAATFTIQPSLYRSWRQVLEQVQANSVGAVIALAAIYLFGNTPIVIGMVMVAVILVCLKLKIAGTIPLTLVTALVMMSQPEFDGLLAAAHKFIVVLVGMGSAFFVNLLVSPPNYSRNFLNEEKETLRLLSLLLRTAISDELTEKSFQQQWNEVKSKLSKMEELYGLLDEEREHISRVRHLDVREIVVFKQKLKCLKYGDSLLEVIEEHYFQSGPIQQERAIFDREIERLMAEHEYLLLKFDRMVKELPDESIYRERNKEFFKKVLQSHKSDSNQKMHQVLVGSAIVEYAFQLERLNELTERFLRRKKVLSPKD
ncbi:hypothetical protein WQ57_08015 [Mesobacillus campisalis]|uniref:Aromatic acid exporter family protein n=1 Tax=Mesobacillus campisalis TaxID=1408103 RepID=A0A0M2SVR3_9BACI|nr:aromatic acid exporter family protein [Mesobacillus campisalis]KKK38659.1 hypothetical protein WQ57_08015 [Mesobacillus campisalis]